MKFPEDFCGIICRAIVNYNQFKVDILLCQYTSYAFFQVFLCIVTG